ncbi:hypothetical protein BCUN_0578 [Bifidobacterium cuniculi]|uniref:Uncharacterized protein n=1 Tax=Bifidobacterium cuniculi TaxID=1688 RepID=A0A087B4X6_9BIFI|nr:DUF2513 domain-containing protein [Bifidobacterium cuniculi]KFI66076.1 hypothetical protein BCUN_0578 [Bifidobacterium cuniculi]
MCRDWDLIRRMLLAVQGTAMSEETAYYGTAINAARFVDAAHDWDTVAYNVDLMQQGGLAEGIVVRTHFGEAVAMHVGPLLWEGLNFLDLFTPAPVWENVKRRLDRVDGHAPYETLMEWGRHAAT